MTTRPSKSRAAALLALALTACDGGAGMKTAADDARLIEVDGVAVTFAELQPYFEWLTEFRPGLGERTKYTWAMREHVLPLKFAQREFAGERAQQRALAEGLCSVATNIKELEQRAALITDKRRSDLTRQSAALPVAMFLFDDFTLNAVSQPIELPHGFFVVSAYDRHESPLVMADYVDALQVGFITHTALDWQKYWQSKREEIGAKVTFLHPDYRDDMPDWIQPPTPEEQ